MRKAFGMEKVGSESKSFPVESETKNISGVERVAEQAGKVTEQRNISPDFEEIMEPLSISKSEKVSETRTSVLGTEKTVESKNVSEVKKVIESRNVAGFEKVNVVKKIDEFSFPDSKKTVDYGDDFRTLEDCLKKVPAEDFKFKIFLQLINLQSGCVDNFETNLPPKITLKFNKYFLIFTATSSQLVLPPKKLPIKMISSSDTTNLKPLRRTLAQKGWSKLPLFNMLLLSR